ncbi:hypothetical protein NWFMUON74_68990 [Nocardia wallacei]|uniref:Uncharacterized protein n=1 Tax=Nocardia wallacei TaxID=480035 RepID=A0A7G1KVB7_9NOCA|nr:hypothetical protein NWFMUON74_68990 [Nocardia wallacei]
MGGGGAKGSTAVTPSEVVNAPAATTARGNTVDDSTSAAATAPATDRESRPADGAAAAANPPSPTAAPTTRAWRDRALTVHPAGTRCPKDDRNECGPTASPCTFTFSRAYQPDGKLRISNVAHLCYIADVS